MSGIFDILRSNRKFNILVLGSDGMLGHDVMEHFIYKSRLKDSNVGIVTGITRADKIDFNTSEGLMRFLSHSVKFDFCINCIAMTDTRRAEETADGRYDSFCLNTLYPKSIAEACAIHGIKLIHISTDWVFSELIVHKASKASFMPFDEPLPTNIYGIHKLQGETNVQNVMLAAGCPDLHMIFRVSWLYGNHKKKSFVHKIILNAVKSLQSGDGTLEVTSNEISIPTSTSYVCDRIEHVIANWRSEVRLGNIKHCVCHEPEKAFSRADFALAVFNSKALHTDLLNGKQLSDVTVVPVERNGYWPKYSVLCSSWMHGNASGYLDSFLCKYGTDIISWARAKANS